MDRLRVITDGADERRDGITIHSWAFVVYDLSTGLAMQSSSGTTVDEMPIHYGEVLAFVKAVEYVKMLLSQGWTAEFNSDSQMLIDILKGTAPIRRTRARYIMDIMKSPMELLSKYDGGVTYQHVKRSVVREADHLVREERQRKAAAILQGEGFIP